MSERQKIFIEKTNYPYVEEKVDVRFSIAYTNWLYKKLDIFKDMMGINADEGIPNMQNEFTEFLYNQPYESWENYV